MFPDLSLEYRVIIGISAMVILFASFLISFVTTQRKKMFYHMELQQLHEHQRIYLLEQNSLLEQHVATRTTELNQQKEALQTSLLELRTTQMQLIQKEKMASLGEVSSGIAHEIQNPLNFVNNFSEVSAELLEELDQELETGGKDYIQQLIADLRDNLTKINLHGKRADSIVKGMQQHSHIQQAQRAPTDLNALADEYLRVAYQSEVAKPGEFSCALETNFDPTVGLVEVVAPEIGRVLLNLYTNAFYALRQRQLTTRDPYAPTLWISTERIAKRVKIRVRDNGAGMPEEVKSRVFQPFFTTRPSGEGTGLGLSMSFDIITKGHAGEIRVESELSEGAEFVMELPG